MQLALKFLLYVVGLEEIVLIAAIYSLIIVLSHTMCYFSRITEVDEIQVLITEIGSGQNFIQIFRNSSF